MKLLAGPRVRALAAAGVYCLLGLAWVLLSDAIGHRLFASGNDLGRFQSWKAVAFVLLSAVVVYLAVLQPWRDAPAEPLPPALPGADAPLVATLARLVLVTALPMAALFGWHLWTQAGTQAEQSERVVRGSAENIARDIGQFLARQAGVARSLARRESVAALDPQRCDRLLFEAAGLATTMLDVTTYDRQGRRVCGGETGLRQVGLPPWLGGLAGAAGPLVGPLEPYGTGSTWMFAIAHPLRDAEGRLAGAVEVLLPSSVLAPVVGATLFEGGSVSVIDQASTVAARDPHPERYVGQPLAPAQREAMAAHAGGQLFQITGLDGVERMAVAVPVPGAPWLAAASLPAEALYAPARQALLRTAVAGLATLLVVVWMVLRVTRQVTRPLGALAQVAERAARGDLAGRAPVGGPAELAAVAQGLNHLLERLPALQAQLVEGERAWREQVGKLARHVPSVVFMFRRDADGRHTVPFVSDAVRALLELEPQDVAQDGDLTLERIHPDDRARVGAALDDSARTLSPLFLSYRLRMPSGRERDVLAVAQPERDGDGVLWYGSLTDVTELHQAQRALQRLNVTLEQRIVERTAELRNANEALEAFSYSVAHDLRAPLASIEGFTLALRESAERGDAARTRHYGERVVANTARMSAMIEGFLALARSGRAPLAEQPLELDTLVAELLQELQPPAGAQVAVAALPVVRADAATFRQVWQNLLSNAFKYSAGRAPAQVAVSCELAGAELVFSVRDNGAGFDPQGAARLFTPFGRLHKDSEFPGTGIGLALVRRIVERHGGRIWADGRPGEGAAFHFTLPRERLLQAPGEAVQRGVV